MRKVSFENGFEHRWPLQKLDTHFKRMSVKKHLEFLEICKDSPSSTIQTLWGIFWIKVSRGRTIEAREMLPQIIRLVEDHSSELGDDAYERYLKADVSTCFSYCQYEIGLEIVEAVIKGLSPKDDISSAYALIHTFGEAGALCLKLGRVDEARSYWTKGLELARKQVWDRGSPDWFEQQLANLT
jgi:hypothetical protein